MNVLCVILLFVNVANCIFNCLHYIVLFLISSCPGTADVTQLSLNACVVVTAPVK